MSQVAQHLSPEVLSALVMCCLQKKKQRDRKLRSQGGKGLLPWQETAFQSQCEPFLGGVGGCKWPWGSFGGSGWEC